MHIQAYIASIAKIYNLRQGGFSLHLTPFIQIVNH